MNTKKLIIGNWKMYPKSVKEAREKFTAIKKIAGSVRDVQTVVCPPALYLGDLKKIVSGHRCVLGAQNAWTEAEGAYTGEVSPLQLSSLGVSYVILGHSERRAMGETDELIQKKVAAALKAGLMVVLCVGEHVRDNDGGYLKHIGEQLALSLAGISKKDLSKIVVAYEPIWAIGAHAERAASPEDALEVAIFIKRILSDMHGKGGDVVPVLYGGSVDAKNAGAFLAQSAISGLLVGRASLDPKVFSAILKSTQLKK